MVTLAVTSGHLIATNGYFSLLLVTSRYFWFLVLVTTAWMYLNMQKYAWLCVNMPKFAWTVFALHFLIVIPCFIQRLHEGRRCSLKEHEAISLKRESLVFSAVVGNIRFAFCFRINIFTSKISNLLLPLRDEWEEGSESYYMFKQSWNIYTIQATCNW